MKANLHTEKDTTEVDHKLEMKNSNVKVEVQGVEISLRMKINLQTENKNPTEIDHKLKMNDSNVMVEVKDVEMKIQNQNSNQQVEEPVQLKKPSGLFSLNGHVVPKSMLIWMFIVTMWRLHYAMELTAIRHEFTRLYRTNNDDFFQLDFQLCSVVQVILGLLVIQMSFCMFRGSCSKRSEFMCFIFGAMGFFHTIRFVPLIVMTYDRFSEFKTEELLSLLKKKNLSHSYEDFYFGCIEAVAIVVVMIYLDYLAMLKFWQSLGVDECSLCGRDPKVIEDRPRQKFSNWDWSLIIIILGLGGLILSTVLYGTVSSLQALEIFSDGVMFTVMTSATFRCMDFNLKMKADL